MEQPEKYICRGALKVRIRTPQGLLDTYSVHLQALLGKDRAQRRLEQIQAMKEWMQSDYRMGQVDQVFIGDFNTSPLTAWGEDNDDPQQPEWKVLEYLRTHFFDCYGVQHNVRSGERLALAPEPLFLAHDNARMGTNLAEPVASLCQGPFLAKGWFLTTKNKRDRKKHKYPDPRVVKPLDKTTPWGSANWNLGQKENHARLDHAMIPNYCSKSFSSIVAEIRRTPIPPDRQSAVSDHLALDLVFKRKIT
jgi:endonuclease/exonuclease/phosphatase family metal-dependent hydrolase